MAYSYQTGSAQDTFAFGQALGCLLEPGDVLLLHGDLGTGKSVLSRGLARGAGIDEPMPSPTFTLMMAYEGRIPFYHMDLYRLSDPDEFFQAGLQEQVGGDGAAVIEWPECAELALDECLEFTLYRAEEEDSRRIELTIHGFETRKDDLLDAIKKWRAAQ